jgi:hypothetical protein
MTCSEKIQCEVKQKEYPFFRLTVHKISEFSFPQKAFESWQMW